MRTGSLACAWALVACAGSAPEAQPVAPPAPAASPTPEAALSPERERFERWKQSAAPADPRGDFARGAETEAERRRSEALAAGPPSAPHQVEQEMAEDARRERAYLLDRLAALGT